VNKWLTITNIAAGARVDFMTDADQGATNLRFIQQPSIVTFAINATAVGCVYEVYSGGRRAVERSAVEAGGTAGVFPNLDQKAQQFAAAAGEILEFAVTGDASGTTDLNMAISVEPIG
jgi:hypothetical protein